ncbi:hypothetical protein ACS3SW_13800 [Roseobacteraceae bacterium S113]
MTRPFLTGFLIFPGFPMACLTSMIEPLRAANEISGRAAFEWRLVAVTQAKVRSSAAIDFEPDLTLAEAVDLDLLMVLSAPTARFESAADAAKLRALKRHGTILGAVSGGSSRWSMPVSGGTAHWLCIGVTSLPLKRISRTIRARIA